MNKIIFVQPSLPSYRIDFFRRIYSKANHKLAVYYSPGKLGVLTNKSPTYPWSNQIGEIVQLLPGLQWQKGALKVPLKRGNVLVVSGGPRCITNMLLLLRARVLGIKVIWWGHLWSSTTKKHRFYLRLLLMRLANEIVFYTDQEVHEYLAGWGRNNKKPITALNNGINIEPITPLRTPYLPEARGRTLLFIGRLRSNTRLEVLLQSLTNPLLADVTLHVIGSGIEEKNLKRLATQLKLKDRVEWHAGTTIEENIAKIANKCAIFVYPGSVGLSLIHAMAYGLPAVTHNSRRHHGPEIAALENGITGQTFIRDDAISLAKEIHGLLNDKNKLHEMSFNALNKLNDNFNTESMSNRFISLL